MKKYDMTVKSFHMGDKNVVVVLGIYNYQIPSMLLFNIEIDIERREDATIPFYEALALKKAASLIHEISDDLAVAA
ncbi:DUF1327 domain-containing protein [Escherichia coli]|uniref:DUF1327 domain-containing protein n=1 Tax=Escherichia coli TaxID=562 RepID=UPI000BB8837B|nr:DUF1327 domain-containing protein [Escherichia coli]EFB5454065.1 DUF1327 domain-containing protein [Escherichia coli O157]EEX1162940.1 DUF1327 domain-containing protein [Escherichia coli]EFH8542982.1 hypothetical protein [Escherichia coli]EFH9256602.1 DUF1327 domain-containing protein [Escherichia coli]EFJ6806625.1 DUF1327 domain-containing protein [Escherichia coli]